MCATSSSSPRWAAGLTSAARISATPAANETWRHTGTGRPWLASDRARNP